MLENIRGNIRGLEQPLRATALTVDGTGHVYCKSVAKNRSDEVHFT